MTQALLTRSVRVWEFELRRAVEVREALRSLLLAHTGPAVDPVAVDVLNRLAQDSQLVVRIEQDGMMRLEPDTGGVMGALGRLLAAALTAQIEGTWERLKACRRCQWVFYDYSKNRSGTWCVMSICGNRVKAQAYRTGHRVLQAKG